MKKILKDNEEKIKESKENIKKEKKQKKYKKKFRKMLKEINTENNTISFKEQIFSMIYFEVIGIVLCLLILFIISGGKNYIKLYKELNKLINVYDTLVSNYYGKIDKEDLIDTAIEAMLNEVGDNYTMYSDEETTNNFLDNIEGTYEGIGCTVATNMAGEIIVADVFENGPASKAGLQVNDIILKIDDKDFSEKTSSDMSNYIKKNLNDKVKLLIKRKDEEIEITILREIVEVPSITSKIIEEDGKKIGYIDISIFSGVTYKQFNKSLKSLEKQDINGLIIDVRGDTGGYLSAVTSISSLFLEKGKIIYQLEDDKKTEKIKDETKEHRTYPIAVLIDGGSASASEILASTIKESYNGLVVGTNSYGKGTVQKTKQLTDGSMIKYTIQKWLTPNGNWIDKIGVEPTNLVNLNSAEEDNQLSTAVDLIKEKIK